MSIVTTNMGLIKWTELTDPYDHAQLAGNFQRIDEHDHTSGKGARLKGASLENEAIGTTQIANLSVTNAKLAGGITSDKLAAGITGAPGDFKWWWRPSNGLTPLPSSTQWQICAGQTLQASEHEFAGGGVIILPNLIGKTIFGEEPNFIGATGGAGSINLQHSHTVANHAHTVPPHNHFLNLETGYNAATNLKISQDLSGSSWVHADSSNNIQHKHSIGGSSNEAGPWETSGASPGTSESLGEFSIIPPYTGFLPLLRVKY